MPLRFLTVAILALTCLASCTGGDSDWKSAESQALEYFEHLRNREFIEAGKMYSKTAFMGPGVKTPEDFQRIFKEVSDYHPSLFDFSYTLTADKAGGGARYGQFRFKVELKWPSGNPLDRAHPTAPKIPLESPMQITIEKVGGTFQVFDVRKWTS